LAIQREKRGDVLVDPVALATFDSRAWVTTFGDLPSDPPRPVNVIDVPSGKVLGTRPRLPRLLDSDFSVW
jgi:hypothetical protein